MRQILAAPLVILGLLAMGSSYLPLGLAMVLLGVVLLQRVTVRAEEAFMGLLMIVGALGALAMFVQYALQVIGWLP
jgi:hypothetical protein